MTIQTASIAVSDEQFMALVGKAVGDWGAMLTGSLLVLGDKLGLFQALADGGPATSEELAARTGTSERYVREWLGAMAAGGYVAYDAAAARYALTPEQVVAFTDASSPAYIIGGYQAMAAAARSMPKLLERFRTGEGLGWHEHDPDLFEGTERFFRPGYAANLTSAWLPALDGVVEKLQRGARVADVGCGHGASTILMAQAYPASTFVGFDYHDGSIAAARRAAAAAGVSDRVRFAVASAKDYPGSGYDLVCFFDCLHDMGDPTGAARHVRETLAPDGTWLLVEPMAGETVAENLNPVGQVFYAASTLLCTPASLAQEVGTALGAQASEHQLRDVVTEAGFARFRRATETPFNRVFEARP